MLLPSLKFSENLLFFNSLFPLLGGHPPIFFTVSSSFFFMEHKYFFPFQQESIFLYFFLLVSSPRTPNVSADRSTKICSVHFLTDHPVWKTSVLATTILREIKHPWPILQQQPSSPMISFTTSGVSGLFSLQERKRCSRFAPTTLLCNTGSTIVLKSLSPEFRQLEYQHSRKQTSLFGGYFWIRECSSETFKS